MQRHALSNRSIAAIKLSCIYETKYKKADLLLTPTADSSRWWVGGVEQSYICLYTPWFSHTHKNVFGSAPHAFKNPSTTVRQMPSIWQPLCDCGNKWTKASVFHHTAALLEICLDLIVLLLKSVKAPCSSRSLRKVLLDDAWADVSSFRGNGERIGRKRWAPLNTVEEVDLAWLSGAINIAQAPGGVWGDSTHHAESRVLLFKHYDDEFYVIPNCKNLSRWKNFENVPTERAHLHHCLIKKPTCLPLSHFQWSEWWKVTTEGGWGTL